MIDVKWRFDHFLSWLYIHRLWGPRCPDFEPTCHTCQHWLEHDEIFNGLDEVPPIEQGDGK